MAQYARPTLDVVINSWRTQSGGSTNLYQAIDEAEPPSASDYIETFQSDVYECQLDTGSITNPGTNTGWSVAVSYAKSSSGGNSRDLAIGLYDDLGTLLAGPWQDTNVPSSWTDANHGLTNAEAQAVRDAGAFVYLRLTGGTGGGTFDRSVRVSYAALIAPDRPPVALTASGSGAATGSAALTRRRGVVAAGAGAATGSATLHRAALGLRASGSGAAIGTAMMGRRRDLGAAGGGTATGSALLSRWRLLTAAATGTASGVADLTIISGTPVLLTASGSGAATGSAALTRRRGVVAAGAGAATGSATLHRLRLLTAAGGGSSSGQAALTVTWFPSPKPLERRHGGVWRLRPDA